MKRAIISKYKQLEDRLTGYVAVMNYRFMNLCVQAEEMSLLEIKTVIEGEQMAIEEVADVAKKNDYEFMIIPKFEDDLLDVAKAITIAHPEFKQKMEKLEIEVTDKEGHPKNRDVPYILVTMPDVDDDRYDVLKDAVKLCYEDCKAQMEMTNQQSQIKMAPLLVDETPEDNDMVKDSIDKLNQEKNELRDKLYKEKLDEIEEAHNRWLAKKNVEDQKKQEEAAARGKDVVSKMKMGQTDE